MKINDNLNIGLEIKPSNIKDAGVGLFASAHLIKGIPVCEYKGDNLLLEQVEERYDNKPGEYALLHPAAKANSNGNQLDVYIDCHPSKSLSEIGLGGFINDKYDHTNRPTGYWDIAELEKDFFKKSNKRLKYLLDNGYNVQFYPVPTQPYFMILSLRDVEPGEELYVDYGDEYWKSWEDEVQLPNNVTKAIESSKPNSPVILK